MITLTLTLTRYLVPCGFKSIYLTHKIVLRPSLEPDCPEVEFFAILLYVFRRYILKTPSTVSLEYGIYTPEMM